jgi:cytochrome c-type biogenesis protein CcmH
MITGFWLYASLLCVLAVAFILIPLLKSKAQLGQPDDGIAAVGKAAYKKVAEDRAALNVTIYEERLADLTLSLEANEIDEQNFDQLYLELQRNLLDEAAPDANLESSVAVASVVSNVSRRGPLVLAVVVPLFAIFAYADFGFAWGAIDDLQIAQDLRGSGQPSGASPHNTTGVSTSVEKLAERLLSQPENDDGWFLLSQSYMRMGEFEKAAGAFKHLQERFPEDAGLSSWLAEALYLQDERQMTPRVAEAIERSLALNPNEVSMLELKAMDAFQRQDLAGSLDWFQRALAAGVEGERATLIQQAITRLEEDLGLPATQFASTVEAQRPAGKTQLAGKSVPAEAIKTVAGSRKLQVLVEVDPTVQVDVNARVFVFARAIKGPPMPLAVQELTVAALPQLIVLDESMAMMAGMGLANFDEVQVVARISSSGIANVSPDDYQALSGPIDLSGKNSVINLTLKTQVKDQ